MMDLCLLYSLSPLFYHHDHIKGTFSDLVSSLKFFVIGTAEREMFLFLWGTMTLLLNYPFSSTHSAFKNHPLYKLQLGLLPFRGLSLSLLFHRRVVFINLQ